MSYSRTPRKLNRMRPYLNELRAADAAATDVSWPSHDPQKLAYDLRDCLASTRLFPEFVTFSPLAERYEIRVKPGRVQAHRLVPDSKAPREEEAVKPLTPTALLELKDINDLPSLIGAAIHFREQADELTFPLAVLDTHDKNTLWAWCRASEVGWKMIDHDEAGITLTRREVPDDVLFTPET